MVYALTKRYDFSSERQCMSVIAQSEKTGGKYAFTKGAPEKIKEICVKHSMTSDFDELVNYFSNEGYRIIAFSYKDLSSESSQTLARMERDAVESNQTLLGFALFENPLKPDAFNTISELNRIKIRNVMVTGDNYLTAASVARKVGIIGPDDNIAFLKMQRNSGIIEIEL